jgi:hypothetical protein
MFPDPLLAVPDAIPQTTLTVLPALLAGPGAVAIVVLGAFAIAAGAALVRKVRTRTDARVHTATDTRANRLAPLPWADSRRGRAA